MASVAYAACSRVVPPTAAARAWGKPATALSRMQSAGRCRRVLSLERGKIVQFAARCEGHSRFPSIRHDKGVPFTGRGKA